MTFGIRFRAEVKATWGCYSVLFVILTGLRTPLEGVVECLFR